MMTKVVAVFFVVLMFTRQVSNSECVSAANRLPFIERCKQVASSGGAIKAHVARHIVANSCWSKSLPDEDSVVSVYTTQATTSGTSGLDVYQQIANNIAERISSPFYRLFRVERNKTEGRPTTKKTWSKIELLDDPEPTQFKEDNEIGRDVEELSDEALKKQTKKPEKFTLYNSYLPVLGLNQNIEQVDQNNTDNNIDDDFEDELTLDDVETTPREGPFIFILELIGSFIQLAWGAIQSLFPSFSSNTSQTEQNN